VNGGNEDGMTLENVIAYLIIAGFLVAAILGLLAMRRMRRRRRHGSHERIDMFSKEP
jgi:hypothetical protein